MSKSLSPKNRSYIDGQVSGGALLRKRDELVTRLQESRRQLDNGEFTEYDDETLAVRIEQLKAKASGLGDCHV